MTAVRMSSRLVEPSTETAQAAELPSASARRTGTSRWRDPRLWLGALLVVASVAIGARVLAAADDTVPVWTVNSAVTAGMAIDSAELSVTRVHFADAAGESRYWLADSPPPAGAHATRDLGPGELLPRSAVSTDAAQVPPQLPLGVAASQLPADLAAGQHVQVWAVPDPADVRQHSRLVLSDAAVLSVADVTVSGLGGDRQVVVALPRGSDTSSVLDALNGATVVLVRIGG